MHSKLFWINIYFLKIVILPDATIGKNHLPSNPRNGRRRRHTTYGRRIKLVRLWRIHPTKKNSPISLRSGPKPPKIIKLPPSQQIIFKISNDLRVHPQKQPQNERFQRINNLHDEIDHPPLLLQPQSLLHQIVKLEFGHNYSQSSNPELSW